jgi:hypothetical protein
MAFPSGSLGTRHKKNMIETIITILDKIEKTPTRFLLALDIVLGLILFSPDQIADKLAVKDFRDNYRIFIGPLFLLVIAVSFINISNNLIKFIKNKKAVWLRNRLLLNLTSEERGYLSEFIIGGKNTIHVPPFDGIAGGLYQKQIIYLASDTSNILIGDAYNLQPWALKYLKKHPDILKGAIGRPQTTEEKIFGKKTYIN